MTSTTRALHRSGPLLAALALALTAAPAAGQVPGPEDVFGFAPGTDYRLADYDQVHRYFQRLDAASERVVVEEIGESTLGKPMILALISSEENLRNRERYRTISRRLALAEGLEDEEARALADEGKAIVWIDGGLHATEVAHGQMTPELAWWAATDESPEARRIRENVIFLLMPNMNPDGLDIVVEWYRGNVGTPFETSPVPELYHHYVGHDNNRDWYMYTQVETKAVADVLWHEWFPQIVYNHHQSSPFPGRIWVPRNKDPVNPNLDPLVVSGMNHMGEYMRTRFEKEGKPGVVSGIVFDFWYSGYMDQASAYRNMVNIISETALYAYATPKCYGPEEIPETFGERAGDLPAKIPSHSYTNPWRGGCWHLRDAVDYMLTGSKAVLDAGARLKDDYLYNVYVMGRRQTARAERAEDGPFAYVVDPAEQHDPYAAAKLLGVLRQGGVEIRRADRSFRAGGRAYDAGAFVIGPQAFWPIVVDMMDPKDYPERRLYPGGPPDRPYDITGYELTTQMGVDVDRVREPFDLPEPVEREIEVSVPGAVTGEGAVFLLPRTSNAAALAVNRLLADGARISTAAADFTGGGRTWPAGTFVIEEVERSSIENLARERALEARAVRGAPSVAQRPLGAPRIGLYKSHVANMAEGWTRWVLEQYGFDYETLHDEDVRSGDLGRFDIVVLPDQEADRILNGHLPGTMPEAYVGGVGIEGAAALEDFVAAGGWLMAFDEAVDLPIRLFGLPVRNAVRELPSEEFFIPGSLLRVTTHPDDPLASGMPEDAIGFFVRSQALEVVPGASEGERAVARDVDVYARYAADDVLASGWEIGGERYVAGKAAALRVPHGEGEVVLIGFSPHYRGQPHNSFKLLFNPLFEAASSGPGR